mmetsp:Transcript_1796/g.3988  ORF Transcript_1796/g.3988 Transcript_1796/m.3988 type:complete len:813 (-) Transcript_1796:985-3423(-)|eukprot:CAMPEP_0202893124 /NCGR_PEP_ID=MMETSP1392-20130828/2756_1 /ASSEMBLY_ACC=CAM_ASM_000868 /TAXON_ID=225041 /ORGANISM="Chlamydomonas chlamydogama, Strain SAG 11-48b" /LENGTH=812 /DNA_ID=CAMNT_0049577331 /DNA_START=244 /DNA_END=2682 /DNA_ORIENTATION=-
MKLHSRVNSAGTSAYGKSAFVDSDDLYGDEDYEEEHRKAKKAGPGGRKPGVHGLSPKATQAAQTHRARPTNNQLLYKAYFRWQHYQHKLRPGTDLPVETDACASVTAAFLQVLQILQSAEQLRIGGQKRSVLQVLSTNTRRTKVVELSSGTHRVPDELRKHYLSDGDGGQYSTNLDRNRYGNDDNYLFTVIRYDLEFLGLCPCLVDVEIIDAKANNSSTIVSSGHEACTCANKVVEAPAMPMPVAAPPPVAPVPPLVVKPEPVPAAMAPQWLPPAVAPARSKDSPKPSQSGVSQLFDALVMAATGGQEGAAAAGVGGDAPVTSPYFTQPRVEAPEAAAPVLEAQAAPRGPVHHSAPQRNRSRLWSALSFGNDSLQNALDAFRAEEEIASGPFEGLPEAVAPGSEPATRLRRRKPPRGNSSFLLRATDSGLFSGLSKLGLSLGFKEKSDENIKQEGTDVQGPVPAESGEEVQNENANEEEEEAEAEAEAVKPGGDETAPHEDLPRRVRYVPRQESAVNLTGRVVAAEVKRLTAELESLRAENRRLREARANSGADGHAAKVENELLALRAEVAQLMVGKKVAEERITSLQTDLARSKQETNILLAKLVGANGAQMALAGSVLPGAQHGLAGAGGFAGLNNGGKEAQMSGGFPWLQQNSMMAAGHGGLDPNSLAGHLAALQQQQQQQQAGAKAAAAVAAAMQNNALMNAHGNAALAMALLGQGGLNGSSMDTLHGLHKLHGGGAGGASLKRQLEGDIGGFDAPLAKRIAMSDAPAGHMGHGEGGLSDVAQMLNSEVVGAPLEPSTGIGDNSGAN